MKKNITLEDFIKEIDFDMLKEQKDELLRFHVDGSNYDTQRLANCVEGVISLLDRIQDIAVDEIGMDAERVFDLENPGYDENAEARKEEKEVDDEKTFKRCQS